jgi:regulator of sigma E protease
MNEIVQSLGTGIDLLLVVLGFGLIVFIHELGHFIAARWAGIRVLAFAVGFGPALVSFRKGLGIRRGSSEAEYQRLLHRDAGATPTLEGLRATRDVVSPTEYRLNALPFGGYVKMLGQDDLDPAAVSAASDSYQRCKPWKRMVVISAGVIMNVITAVVLFIVVFMIGLKVEPAKVGSVQPGSPASITFADNGADAGVRAPGLLPGDVFVTINGDEPNSFNDLVLATAMAKKDRPIEVVVRRPGIDDLLTFRITPREGELSGLLEIGVEPSRSAQIPEAASPMEREIGLEVLTKLGLPGVEPGMRLARIDGVEVDEGNALLTAVRNSGGQPLTAEFEGAAGTRSLTLKPRPQLQLDHAPRPMGKVTPIEHLLGLTPVMTVQEVSDAAKQKGLASGDIFARIGNVEYPNIVQGMSEIKSHKGRSIPIVVLRKDDAGVWQEVELPAVEVSRKGTVGFYVGDTSEDSALVSLPPARLRHPGAESEFEPSAASVIISPGTRITKVDGRTVASFADIRAALIEATISAFRTGEPQAVVNLTVRRPVAGRLDDAAAEESFEWRISRHDVVSLHSLGWESPLAALPFDAEQVVRRAATPLAAVKMGLAETNRVMLTTYVTFARLAEGTVKVEHLKGPVGIAHLGTLIAGKGFIWLLFFLALISVNLAVINFLPLPIVDGGQFLFLVFEQVRGKPVPLGVQNAATLAGLVLIGSMFLIVTYNDITNLLGL